MAIPTRDDLERLFPVTQRLDLDQRARRELRTIGEYMRIAGAIAATVEGASGKDPRHILVVANAATADAGGVEAAMPAVAARMSERTDAMSDEDYDYYLSSGGLTNLSAFYTPDGAATPVMNFSRPLWAFYDAPCGVADAVVNRAAARLHPGIRFFMTRFVHVTVHWSDLDRDGSPRTSIDGYKL